MKKVILFVNQFFAGVGSEDKANAKPMILEGVVGSGIVLQAGLKNAVITHTIVCGDNYMNSHKDAALREIKGFMDGKMFDLFLAGPAFQSGRYGMNCGTLCQFINEIYKVPSVTCMHEENPGREAFRENLNTYIMRGHKSAARMREDTMLMANFANKILAGEEILWADAEGYFGHGVRKEVFVDKKPSERALEMLFAKIKGDEFVTEYKIEVHDKIAPAHAVNDVHKSKIALITTGGLVPIGNPDRIPSGTASIWKAYSIDKMESLAPSDFYSVHGGFSTDYVNANPEVLLPLKTVRMLEKEGAFKELEPYIYSTTGNLTALKDAKRMGREIANVLKDHLVDAALLVST